MIDEDEARRLAEEYLHRHIQPYIEEEVIISSVREFAKVWVFGYNTRAFIETKSVRHALAGGGPIIVNKSDGTISQASTSRPIEDQVGGDESRS